MKKINKPELNDKPVRISGEITIKMRRAMLDLEEKTGISESAKEFAEKAINERIERLQVA